MGYLAVNRTLKNVSGCGLGILKAKDVRDTMPSKRERENLHEVHKMDNVFWQLALQDLNYYTNYTAALPSTLTAFCQGLDLLLKIMF